MSVLSFFKPFSVLYSCIILLNWQWEACTMFSTNNRENIPCQHRRTQIVSGEVGVQRVLLNFTILKMSPKKLYHFMQSISGQHETLQRRWKEDVCHASRNHAVVQSHLQTREKPGRTIHLYSGAVCFFFISKYQRIIHLTTIWPNANTF